MTASSSVKSLVNIDTTLNMYVNGGGNVWVNIDHKGVRISSALVTPETLRTMADEVAPAGSYTRTDEEDWQARAVKAEQAPVEMTVNCDQCRGIAIKWPNRLEQPRPFTPDDIYDNPEMTNRAIAKGMEWGLFSSRDRDQAEAWNRVEQILVAALAEPTRPEGAEAVSSVLDALREDDGEWMTYASDEDLDGLADALAERGVRVTGAES